jgi:hypothetical protein
LPIHRRAVPPRLRAITRHALLTYARLHWPRWHFGLLAAVVGLEAWARQLWASWRGEQRSAHIFAETGGMVRDLCTARPTLARQRLQKIIDIGERGVSAA